MKIPKHKNVFIISEKIAIHCTFSHDSDEETGDWPIPMGREVIYGYSILRFLNFNYIYANLALCELTAQEKGREAPCPPQAQV